MRKFEILLEEIEKLITRFPKSSLFFFFTIILLLPLILTNKYIYLVDFSKTGNIGDTIAGITAPFIGMISAVLLYVALTKQIENNNDHRKRNEVDLMFALLNQLDTELNNFSFTKKGTVDGERLYGYPAIHEFVVTFCNSFVYHTDGQVTFGNFYGVKQFVYLTRSYSLAMENLTSLESEQRILFEKKLNSFFMCFLATPLNRLVNTLSDHKDLKDELSIELESLYPPDSQLIEDYFNTEDDSEGQAKNEGKPFI